MRWYALSEVPPGIRELMAATWAKWDTRDLTLDGTLALIHEEERAIRQVGNVSRAVGNRARVPALCEVVHSNGISWRSSWCAVGLFLGLHPSHVQALWYRRPQ